MALENAKKFLALILEDEALRDRTANRGEEEVMAAAKEMGTETGDTDGKRPAILKTNGSAG